MNLVHDVTFHLEPPTETGTATSGFRGPRQTVLRLGERVRTLESSAARWRRTMIPLILGAGHAVNGWR